MYKKLIILVFLICSFSSLLSANNKFYPSNDEKLKFERLNSLVKEHESTMDLLVAELPERRRNFEFYLAKKQDRYHDYYLRMTELDLWLHAKNWRYPLILGYYCNAADDLYKKYHEEIEHFNIFRNEQLSGIDEFLNYAKRLKSLDRERLSSADNKLLEKCLARSEKYEQVCDSFIGYLNTQVLHFTQLDTPLLDLKNEASVLRTQMMKKIFFSPEAPLPEILSGESFVMINIRGDLAYFLGAQLAILKLLWFPFLLVMVIPFPLCLLAASLIFKHVRKNFEIEDWRPKRNYVVFGLGLIILAMISQVLRMSQIESAVLYLEITRYMATVGLLILAIAIRCNGSEVAQVLRLYHPMIYYYLMVGALWVGMVNYTMMAFVSPFLNIGFIFLSFIIVFRYHKRLPGFDMGLTWVSIIIAFLGLILSYFGYVYSSFAMIIFLFVVLLGSQVAKAASCLIDIFIRTHPKMLIVNCVLQTLVLPLMTLGVLFFGVDWTAKMFNITSALKEMLDKNIVSFSGGFGFSVLDILVIIITGIAIRFILRLVRRIVEISYAEAAQFGIIPTILTLINYLAWALFVVYAMLMINVNYQSMLVIIGGMSMGIGFGLKDVVDNFACGIGLLVGQQLRPGDEIECDGIRGTIKTVGFRLTVLESCDGAVVCFQNADILRKNFKNMTSNHGLERADIVIGVAYGTDTELVRQAMLEGIKQCRNVSTHPRPEIILSEFDASSINFIARIWVPVNVKMITCSAVREAIYQSFKNYNIEIPFPQLDIHVKKETPNAQ